MPDGLVRLKGCARNGACASGLSGRRCSTRREWTICVFSASSATTIEMPMLPPILRIRLKIAVPCVRICRGKVEKVTVLSGVKMKPRPNPCKKPERGDRRLDPDLDRAEPILQLAAIEQHLQRADRQAQCCETEKVKGFAMRPAGVVDEHQDADRGEHAKRQVDVEHPAPIVEIG